MTSLPILLRRRRRIRAIGIDDAPFIRGQTKDVVIVGAICGNTRFEGLLTSRVRPDGFNATKRVAEMIARSKFMEQLHLVLLDGITLGGFNVIDLLTLSQTLSLPVVAVTRQTPDMPAVLRVVDQLTKPQLRRKMIARAGPIYQGDGVTYQVQGADHKIIGQVLTQLTDTGRIPEPLRLAHLIGGGIVCGESGKRA